MRTLWNALMCKAPRRMISYFPPFFYTKVKFLCVDYWNICGRALEKPHKFGDLQQVLLEDH